MNSIVVCYVPGSGGVKLSGLLANVTSVNHFKFMQHEHDPNCVSENLLKFSLNETIQNLMLSKSCVDSLITSGDDDSSKIFLYLNQNGNLTDGLFNETGAYLGPDQCTMTHCMSYNVARMRYPNRFHVKILCDIKMSLRRWWKVYAKDSVTATPFVPEQYYDHVQLLQDKSHRHIAALIIMHLDYYNQYYDIDADYAINLHRVDNEFSEFMLRDLNRCQDREFDVVWSHLMQHSDLAIIRQKLRDKIT